MFKTALTAGTICAAIAVALGAFGAHGLKKIADPATIDIWNKGITYQFYHSFALLAAGILFATFPFSATKWAAYLFIIGIVLFSGSLYLLTALKINAPDSGLMKVVGPITPLGGLAFIAGWICLLIAILKKG